MKRVIVSMFALLMYTISIAQVPESFSYQAIVRDGGDIVANQLVSYRFSIIKGTPGGSVVYTEKHSATTNQFGLVTIAIGTGIDKTGDFTTIEWGADSYFLKVEIDPVGGTSYTDMGTMPFLSVPYALHAKTADMTTGDSIWKKSVENIYYSDGNVGIGTENPLYPVHIASPLISGPETLFKASVADDPNSFFEIGNATISDGKFMPAIISHNGTDHRQGLFILAKTTDELDDMGGYPVITFDARRMEGPIINRPLFQWGSAGDIKMTMLANGNVGVGIINPAQNLSVSGVIESTTGGFKFPDGTVQTKVTTSYSIGDFAQGGIVFWVDETGQHGLVCAKNDQDGGSGVRWYAGTYGKAKGDGPFSGETNTSIIISAQVAIGDDGSTYAARICNELQITEGGKTYGDWYLPSKEELNLMWENIITINNAATANGGSSFLPEIYWSSTEYSLAHAYQQWFQHGFQETYQKDWAQHVRAIRAF